MALEHEDLIARIIGAAILMHRQLGEGLLKSPYEKTLIVELGLRPG